jgi:uncharacterized glyoxalase superfamily protein PhnB
MATILQNHYVLAVHDARACARFFVEGLGFRVVREPEGWVFVAKDGCMVMLGECPGDMRASELGCHSYFGYLRVDDVDGYFAEVKGRGVDLASAPADKPWGMREFGLRTPEGHRIMIGQVIGG